MKSCLKVFLCCTSLCISTLSYGDGPLTKTSLESKRPEQPRTLNDTGITWAGDYPKGINDKCEARFQNSTSTINEQITREQDCSTGRDALPPNVNDGAAGFVFTKINNQGKNLPEKAKEWRCVSDEISGLMWEVKSSIEGLHHRDDLYTWYSSDKKNNGGNIGDWNSRGAHCHGYVAGTPRSYCHVEQFVSRVNKKGLCGFKDWRLPSREELTSLIHFGETEPAIDLAYFPKTKSDFYWSASPVADRTQEAWAISFQFGFTTPMRRTDTRYARLVRSLKN